MTHGSSVRDDCVSNSADKQIDADENAFGVLRADKLCERVWVELFPWLDEYESDRAVELESLIPGSDDWWVVDTPRDTAAVADVMGLVDDLAGLFVRRHRATALTSAAPSLDPAIPMAALRLDSRAETVVRRIDKSGAVAALLRVSAADLFAIRGTSADTAQRVVAGVFTAAIVTDPAEGVDLTEPRINPAITQLVDDVHMLARWRRIRGRADEPIVHVDIDDDAPEDIQYLSERISAVVAADLDILPEPNPIDEIENLIEQLDERETVALRERLMAANPVSMGELSVRLHVSRSRASAIISDIKNRFTAACDFATAVGALLASMRAEIQPITPLSRLIRLHPVLAETVPSLGVELWFVLDRLDDYFEVTGNWAAAPDVVAARGRTLAVLEDLESPYGTVDIASAGEILRLDKSEVLDWLRICEIPVVNGRALLVTRRASDHAVAVLEAVRRPLAIAELAELMDGMRLEKTVDRALADDARAYKDSDDRWSVIADDQSVGGHGGTRANKDLRQTRRLYQVDGGWMFRFTVSADHLRGSGITIPAGVARAFGCQRGSIHEVSSELGVQVFRWTGTYPTCGTVRRFLNVLSLAPGDQAFLCYHPDRGFEVRAVSIPQAAVRGDAVREALALIGHRDPDGVATDELDSYLAESIGLPADTKRRRILSAFRGRDNEVESLLEAGWVSK